MWILLVAANDQYDLHIYTQVTHFTCTFSLGPRCQRKVMKGQSNRGEEESAWYLHVACTNIPYFFYHIHNTAKLSVVWVTQNYLMYTTELCEFNSVHAGTFGVQDHTVYAAQTLWSV